MLADVVWPSLLLVSRLYAWWIIAAGLVIEYLFVQLLTKTSPPRAALMTVCMNAVSSAIGWIGILLFGSLWDLAGSMLLSPLYLTGWKVAPQVHWLGSTAVAALVSTAIELSTLCVFFGITWTKRFFWWLALANFVTTGIAVWSILAMPSAKYPSLFDWLFFRH
jgi:hypothetical protein